MFASKCVSGRTDASMLVLGRWSWGVTDSIQVMFPSLPVTGAGWLWHCSAGDSQQTHRNGGAGSDGDAPGGSQGSRC